MTFNYPSDHFLATDTAMTAIFFTGMALLFLLLMREYFSMSTSPKFATSTPEISKLITPITVTITRSSSKKSAKRSKIDVIIPDITSPDHPKKANSNTSVIAAIAAAVAMMGKNLVVRSIMRTSDGAELWASAGRVENSSFN